MSAKPKPSPLDSAMAELERCRALVKKDDKPASREQLAKALLKAFNALSEDGKMKEAFELLAESRTLAGEHEEPALREALARALVNAVSAAGDIHDFTGIHKLLVESRTLAATHNKEPALREALAKALFNAFYDHSKAGKMKEALELLAELRALAGNNKEPAPREQLARALANALNDLSKSGNMKDAPGLLDELRALAAAHKEPALREALARALLNAVSYAGDARDFAGLNKLLDELRALAATHEEPALRERLAKALFNASYDLRQAGYIKEASELLDELRTLAETHDEPALREALAGPPSATDSLTPRGRHRQSLKKVILQSSIVKDRFLQKMAQRGKRIENFLAPESNFAPEASVLLILRQWNSFTPIVVDAIDSDKGGGYFIYHRKKGLVIDPGYNFIEHFYNACGRIHDIDYIAVTHAHDDHTAQLEQLFTLLHQYNKREKKRSGKRNSKQITLLLSHGVAKKFSGFSFYKDAGYIERVIILNAFDPDNIQIVKLSNGLSLTVLPAYHDDIFSADYALGLGLTVGDSSKTLLFTSDTSLFPIQLKEDGKPDKFKEQTYKDIAKVKEDQPGEAVHCKYPAPFDRQPDLLVPHIGSIEEYEFNPSQDQELPMFYPNHLGLLGTATLIKELQPKAVILSEFGSELKDLRMEIQRILLQSLPEKTESGPRPFITPGDTTIAYEISKGKFLCHDSLGFMEPKFIKCMTTTGGQIVLFNRDGHSASLDDYYAVLRGYRDGNAEPSAGRLPYFRKLCES